MSKGFPTAIPTLPERKPLIKSADMDREAFFCGWEVAHYQARSVDFNGKSDTVKWMKLREMA
jgi:hypothetical protein